MCLNAPLQLGVHNIRATRFFQGKTVRWGLAWSLSSDGCDARGRPPVSHQYHLALIRRLRRPPVRHKQ
jgi:hypothetical protein